MTDVLEPSAPLVRGEAVGTSNGPVRGYREGGVNVFKGLRYGAPPVGPLRFKPPQRPAAWTQPADAVALGTPALQAGLASRHRRAAVAAREIPLPPASPGPARTACSSMSGPLKRAVSSAQ